MIRISRPALLAALFVLAAAPVAAQEPASPPVRVYGGLSVGPHSYPDDIRPRCGGSSYGVGEARVGATSGPLALEVRGTAVLAYLSESCPLAIADEAPPPDGISTFREFGFDRKNPAGSVDARLRFGGTRAMPLVVAAGGGRLMGPGISYAVASVGFRSRGTTRVALDLEGNLYRMPSDQARREFQGGQLVREVSRDRRVAWESGVGLRLGVERELF